MQFGWLKENIKALAYWIWRHVQIRISLATLFYWLGEKRITSSSCTPSCPRPPRPTPHCHAHPLAPSFAHPLPPPSHSQTNLDRRTSWQDTRLFTSHPNSACFHLLNLFPYIFTLNSHNYLGFCRKDYLPYCPLIRQLKPEQTRCAPTFYTNFYVVL